MFRADGEAEVFFFEADNLASACKRVLNDEYIEFDFWLHDTPEIRIKLTEDLIQFNTNPQVTSIFRKYIPDARYDENGVSIAYSDLAKYSTLLEDEIDEKTDCSLPNCFIHLLEVPENYRYMTYDSGGYLLDLYRFKYPIEEPREISKLYEFTNVKNTELLNQTRICNFQCTIPQIAAIKKIQDWLRKVSRNRANRDQSH